MAQEARGSKTGKRRSRPLNYFYLNDNLHKKLHINRGADELTAWCYPTERRVTLPYADAKRRMQPAFTTQEVSKMLNRGRLSLENAILAGEFDRPQHTYGLDENKKLYKYMWSERDIMAAHAYFSTVHKGRPRKDGLITPMRLPSARELRAIIRDEEVLYVMRDGEYRPTWQAPDI